MIYDEFYFIFHISNYFFQNILNAIKILPNLLNIICVFAIVIYYLTNASINQNQLNKSHEN